MNIHTLRKPHGYIIRTLLCLNPQGSRKRNIPSNTWRPKVAAEIVEAGYIRSEFKTLAMNKSDWNVKLLLATMGRYQIIPSPLETGGIRQNMTYNRDLQKIS